MQTTAGCLWGLGRADAGPNNFATMEELPGVGKWHSELRRTRGRNDPTACSRACISDATSVKSTQVMTGRVLDIQVVTHLSFCLKLSKADRRLRTNATKGKGSDQRSAAACGVADNMFRCSAVSAFLVRLLGAPRNAGRTGARARWPPGRSPICPRRQLEPHRLQVDSDPPRPGPPNRPARRWQSRPSA